MNKLALLLCIFLSVAICKAQHVHFYAKSSGNIYTLSTWGSIPDGSGASPTSFGMNNAVFHFQNRSFFQLSSTVNWVVNGVNSGMVVGNGMVPTVLKIPRGYSLLTDSIFIDSGSVLLNEGSAIWNKSLFSYFSSVVYNDTTMNQLVMPGAYGRLFLEGGSTNRFWPDTRIKRLAGDVVAANLLSISCFLFCDSFSITVGTSSVQTGSLNYSYSYYFGSQSYPYYGGINGKLYRWMPMGSVSYTQGLFPMISSNRKFNLLSLTTTQVPMFGGLVSVEYLNYWPGNFGLPIYDSTALIPLQLNKVDQGFFKIETHNGFSGGRYSVNVNPLNMGGIVWEGGLRLLKRTSTGSPWQMDSGSYSGGASAFDPHTGVMNMPNLDGDYVISSDSTINYLPIELGFVKLSLIDNYLNLHWETLSEINADFFQISTIVGLDTIMVGKVKAQGNSVVKRKYSFDFPDRLSLNNTYVLLEAFDRDGSKSFSKTLPVIQELESGKFELLPNPFSEEVKIQTTEAITFNMRVFNALGELQWEGEMGHDKFILNTEDFPSGLYYFEIVLGSYLYHFKQVKR